MTDTPFVPGTFWDIGGRRYVIDPATRWVRLDEPVLFRILPMAPDTDGAIQLHLVPVAEPGGLRMAVEALRADAQAAATREDALGQQVVTVRWLDEWLTRVLVAHSTEGGPTDG